MMGDTDIKVIQQNVSLPNVNNQPGCWCPFRYVYFFAISAAFIIDLNCMLFLPYPGLISYCQEFLLALLRLL